MNSKPEELNGPEQISANLLATIVQIGDKSPEYIRAQVNAFRREIGQEIERHVQLAYEQGRKLRDQQERQDVTIILPGLSSSGNFGG